MGRSNSWLKRAKENICQLEDISEEEIRDKEQKKKGEKCRRVKGEDDTCNWNSKRREGRWSKSNMRLIHNLKKISGHRLKKPYETQVKQIKRNSQFGASW